MGLQAITQASVKRVASALGDLAIPLTLRKRVKAAYVPGSPQAYVNTDLVVKGVITRFRQHEVDGTQIQSTDLLVVVFPPLTKEIPEPNDVLVNGLKEYRIIANSPMYAGSEIAFNMLQVRPPV